MRLFFNALLSPAGKGLALWLSFVVSNCEVVIFSIGILGNVWCLIVSIPDISLFLILVKLARNGMLLRLYGR